ncbi:hypothetical protein [Tahibacter soli]|uniref:DUF4412 domain-containing protein n=1 Tax=Tahibacter soli TaxID=2983605 RepID=A0A9X3YKQ7_9GAMM|nr:hypothetical protein [Tahibacter soli]MDC8014062.1 hypothetical protein [Tahibacter soli]
MNRTIRWLLPALAAAMPALAADNGGECRRGDQVLNLTDGYAYRAPDEYADGRMMVHVVLSSVALDRGKLAGAKEIEDAIREQVWDKDGGQVALTIDGNDVTSVNAFLPPGTSTSRSGTAFGELKLARSDDRGVAGTFRYPPAGDGDLGCDVRFDIAYATAADAKAATAARTGKPLPAGGGDAGKVFQANLAAMRKGDIPGLLATLNAEQAGKLRQDQNKPDFKAMLGMMQAFAPKSLKVTGGRDLGDRAELDLEGQDQDGSATSGTATMVKEGGAWKVERTSLKSKMGG